MEPIQCDVVILGGGIAGYTAAIRAAQLGKKAVVVEKEKLGGTCLHRGCIPSKAYLQSAELFAKLSEGEKYGIRSNKMELDFERVRSRKEEIVSQLYQGLQLLMRKHKIEVIEGNGRVIGPSIFSPKSGAIAVEKANGDTVTVVGDYTILATGSRPKKLKGLPDDAKIMTSDEVLEMETLPKEILIVGGGVIGVEWASMLHDFGVQVTIVEASDRLLPQEDSAISRELEQSFKRRGIHVYTKASLRVDRVETDQEKVYAPIETADGMKGLQGDALLISVGRVGNVEGIGLENTDVAYENGVVLTNSHFQTGESHIYAVGDLAGGLQLAHAAAHEAVHAVNHCFGQAQHTYDPVKIPKCVYGRPEVASVGLSEEAARDRGFKIKIGRFPFSALGKAWVMGETEGFVKVVANEETDDLLGVHIIGARATDLIAEGALAQWLDATPWELGLVAHPHPSLSEAVGEAMLSVYGKALGI